MIIDSLLFEKFTFLLLGFYERKALVHVLTNGKKSEGDFCFYQKKR